LLFLFFFFFFLLSLLFNTLQYPGTEKITCHDYGFSTFVNIKHRLHLINKCKFSSKYLDNANSKYNCLLIYKRTIAYILEHYYTKTEFNQYPYSHKLLKIVYFIYVKKYRATLFQIRLLGVTFNIT